MDTRNKHIKGFSLVELLITIIIMSLVTSSMFLLFNSIQKKTMQERVVSDLNSYVKGVFLYLDATLSAAEGDSIKKINDVNGNSYALKYYPDLLMDERPRLETEFLTLTLLHKHGFENVPKPIERNDDLNLGLYEWADGEKISQPLDSDLDQAINFIEKLVTLSKELLD